MIRTYKYRLRPNGTQNKLLDQLFWQSRGLYNNALEQRIVTYKESGKGYRYTDQWAYFRDERKSNPDYNLLNATSVQQMLRRLDKAFSAFFRRIKKGENPGFPRFKGYRRFKSVEYRYGDGCKMRHKENGQTRFYIQNVGEIKVVYHRPIPETANIKHVVVKRFNEKWYVCLMMEIPDAPKATHQGGCVGIDMGLKSLLATSDGVLVENPQWLRESQSQLRIAQRKAARRKIGSNRRRKAVQQVAILHEKIANQRKDYWHKVARELANHYSLVALEDLNLKFMNRNKYLALSSYDAGLGMFTKLIAYKVEETGGQLVIVNPAYTSQACSQCGAIVEKSLAVRVHRCPECGLELDRDVNAARNILQKAFVALGLSVQDLTWANAPCVS
jgi:putative transposase